MSICEGILSLNVRGLRDPTKRRELFRWIKRFHNGANCITFLQETHTLDKDLLTWEKEWGSKVLMSHGTSNSRGVAMLLPQNYDFIIDKYCTDDNGRTIALSLSLEDTEYCLINVYAPTSDHEADQVEFLKSIRINIEENLQRKLIIGGDFNICLEKIDKSSNVLSRSKARDEILQIMETYDLLDIWRINHPETKRYTWRRRNPFTQSRLDYWLIGADVSYNIQNCDVKPSIKSDHSLITIKFTQTAKMKRGTGLWKFNASLLSDIDYIGFMQGMIEHLSKKYENIADKSLKWELIKMDIRKETIAYSKVQCGLKREHENNLNENYYKINVLLETNPTDVLQTELLSIKSELEVINAIKTEGYRIRAKALHIEHNEKGSKYFIGLEKRNANIKNITRLKLENGQEITEPGDIFKELLTFYENLYKAEKLDDDSNNIFFNENIPSISVEDSLFCDKLIDIDECSKALSKMKINKSPGTDGLTVEFYRFFWNNIKSLVLDSYHTALINNSLSSEQKRGVLRLIPKKGKDLVNIKNWRPISLLNTDYKLLTHVLSNRIQKALPSVISIDQSGYLKGRNIGINIRSVFDIIEKVESEKSSALLGFLDFEKAFDKLNWCFIQKVLEKFGFGQAFRNWVKILYTNIESCILNNGTTSKYFSIKSGIRQGCPLSALIFILAVELLAIGLRTNDDIHGIKIGKMSFKITQLADDTTLFLKDINSLENALGMLKIFRSISGLKLNETKTEILQIGTPLTSNYSLFDLKWKKERIYSLGTWFYKDMNKSIIETYECRLNLVRNTLNSWRHRNLTWIGKITVIKTLCIAKINYAISSMETPQWFIDQINVLFEDFLWNGKPPRVKKEVMYNDYEYGGLRMTCLQHYISAQKVNWIKQLITNDNIIPNQYISLFLKINLTDFLKCTFDEKVLPKTIPNFYKEIFVAWFMLKNNPVTPGDIQREVIWYNKFIKIDNKSIFIERLYKNGLIYVNDILDAAGHFLDYNSLIEKFGNHISQFMYTCVKHAIPSTWRKLLTARPLMVINPKAEGIFYKSKSSLIPVKLLQSKQVYWALNTVKVAKPTCVRTWFEKYLIEFSDCQWKTIFRLAKFTTANTKLVEFQFKIIHRVYATDSYVANFDATVNKMCAQCKVSNNIPHLFVDCMKVTDFWTQFKLWISIIEGHNIKLSSSNIIFGILNNAAYRQNFCILQAKWFIHLHKTDYLINFNQFLLYFTGVLCVERQLAVNLKRENEFDKIFNVFN